MMKKLEAIDLFTYPFNFKIKQNDKGLRTFTGALLTITVLALAIGYFSFIMYEWFSGEMGPVIS